MISSRRDAVSSGSSGETLAWPRRGRRAARRSFQTLTRIVFNHAKTLRVVAEGLEGPPGAREGLLGEVLGVVAVVREVVSEAVHARPVPQVEVGEDLLEVLVHRPSPRGFHEERPQFAAKSYRRERIVTRLSPEATWRREATLSARDTSASPGVSVQATKINGRVRDRSVVREGPSFVRRFRLVSRRCHIGRGHSVSSLSLLIEPDWQVSSIRLTDSRRRRAGTQGVERSHSWTSPYRKRPR